MYRVLLRAHSDRFVLFVLFFSLRIALTGRKTPTYLLTLLTQATASCSTCGTRKNLFPQTVYDTRRPDGIINKLFIQWVAKRKSIQNACVKTEQQRPPSSAHFQAVFWDHI